MVTFRTNKRHDSRRTQFFALKPIRRLWLLASMVSAPHSRLANGLCVALPIQLLTIGIARPITLWRIAGFRHLPIEHQLHTGRHSTLVQPGLLASQPVQLLAAQSTGAAAHGRQSDGLPLCAAAVLVLTSLFPVHTHFSLLFAHLARLHPFLAQVHARRLQRPLRQPQSQLRVPVAPVLAPLDALHQLLAHVAQTSVAHLTALLAGQSLVRLQSQLLGQHAVLALVGQLLAHVHLVATHLSRLLTQLAQNQHARHQQLVQSVPHIHTARLLPRHTIQLLARFAVIAQVLTVHHALLAVWRDLLAGVAHLFAQLAGLQRTRSRVSDCDLLAPANHQNHIWPWHLIGTMAELMHDKNSHSPTNTHTHSLGLQWMHCAKKPKTLSIISC